MMRKLWLFGLVLGIPIIAFAVAESIQAHFNSDLRAAIRQNYPNVDPEKLASFTVDLLCKDPKLSIREICDTYANLNIMRNTALGSAGAGIALLLLIYLGGVSARSNRKLLLSLFKPGLYLTASILIILILIYGAVAMAAIYYGESALIGRIHVKIIVLIGIGALVGVLVLARNAFALIKKAQTSVIGTTLSRDEAPKLWGKVEQLSEKLGALRPHNIVVGLTPTFLLQRLTLFA